MHTSDMLQMGKAGEYLACTDLILKGFVAFPSEQGLPYDVLLDTGVNILRVQVKTTGGERNVQTKSGRPRKAYTFGARRGGVGNNRNYEDGEFEIIALVCLDLMQVGYTLLSDMPSTLNVRVESESGTYSNELGAALRDKVFALKKEHSNTHIAKMLGIDKQRVGKILKPGYKTREPAPYFSDFLRDRDWFLKQEVSRKVRMG